MKNAIIFLSLLIFTLESFGQAQTSPEISKEFYLKKSKSQKKIGWILLGTGLGIAAAGSAVLIGVEHGGEYGVEGGPLLAVGSGIALSSIPFFISSSSNRRKAGISNESYLQKSRSQKKTAWILLGTGLGIAAVGTVVQIANRDNWDFTGAAVAVGGGVVALTSIPFFISSNGNKKRAASVVISNQKIFLPRANNFSLTAQPTITLNIGL